MEINELVNFETSCSCEVCSECQIKTLSDYYNCEGLNYLENYDNYIKKANIRPEECCLFEKYQLFDMNASIPWNMKHYIRNCFNEWRNCKVNGLDVGCIMALNELKRERVLYYEFGYTYTFLNPHFKPNQNTRTILFRNELNGLYYAVLLTKKHTFTLKTLAGLKVNEHFGNKCQLDYLVEKRFLPKQLADFLLNLHKM